MRKPASPDGKALGTLALLAVLYTLYFASAILLPFVLAIVLYSAAVAGDAAPDPACRTCPSRWPRCC